MPPPEILAATVCPIGVRFLDSVMAQGGREGGVKARFRFDRWSSRLEFEPFHLGCYR